MTTGPAAPRDRRRQRINRHPKHRPLPRRSPAAASTPVRRRTRVLVIADRARIALEVQRALAAAGYRTVGPATSTEEARRLLSRFAIDCAIVDLDAGGAAATDLLERQGTPFVILTSRMDPPPEHASRPRLHVPADCDDVMATVERAMGASPGSDEVRYRIEPLSMSWPRVFPQL